MWAKPLHDGSVGVVAFNRGDEALASVPLTWAIIGLQAGTAARVRSLTDHADLANVTAGTDLFTVGEIPSHDVAVLRFFPM